jgi:2-oxoglutarate ferredoxin oxidoreductase subunit beta
LSTKRALQDFRSIIEPIWCPGCGDYGVLTSLQKALLTLDIPPENIVAVSGIGCSGRLNHFLNTYSLHGTHGRAIPTALGVKTARPDLTVMAIGGDGDGLGIGGGHIPHAARKNVDLTYLLIDNCIYGLTKGQSSPTSPLGQRTKSSPYGVYEDSLDAMPILLAYDVSFVARGISINVKELTDLLISAVNHKGLSIVYILSPCVSFPVLDGKKLRTLVEPLPVDHPRDNKLKAIERAYVTTPIYTGIFYQVLKPTLEHRLQAEIQKACRKNDGKGLLTTREVLHSFA